LVSAARPEEDIVLLTGSARRFCEITQLDPIEQLKLFPIGVLNSFFHWLLHERSDTLHAKSSVQTYWNALGLVRRKETGCCVIDLETKREWQGVRTPHLRR
jgi:hypothetical protein